MRTLSHISSLWFWGDTNLEFALTPPLPLYKSNTWKRLDKLQGGQSGPRCLLWLIPVWGGCLCLHSVQEFCLHKTFEVSLSSIVHSGASYKTLSSPNQPDFTPNPNPSVGGGLCLRSLHQLMPPKNFSYFTLLHSVGSATKQYGPWTSVWVQITLISPQFEPCLFSENQMYFNFIEI